MLFWQGNLKSWPFQHTDQCEITYSGKKTHFYLFLHVDAFQIWLRYHYGQLYESMYLQCLCCQKAKEMPESIKKGIENKAEDTVMHFPQRVLLDLTGFGFNWFNWFHSSQAISSLQSGGDCSTKGRQTQATFNLVVLPDSALKIRWPCLQSPQGRDGLLLLTPLHLHCSII